MLTTFLIIYAVVGLLFLAGVAAAAKRPVPRMDTEGVVTPLPHPSRLASGEMTWRKAA